MATIIDYTNFQRVKRTISDNSVISYTNVNAVVLPQNGDSYLNNTTVGIFTANRLYVYDSGQWFEYDPSSNPGIYIYDNTNSALYQIDSIGVPILQIFAQGYLQNASTIVQSFLANTRTLCSNFFLNSDPSVGTYTASNFTTTSDGIYGIQFLSSTGGIAGSLIALDIYESGTPNILSSSTSTNISLDCGTSFIGFLNMGDVIEFYLTSTLAGDSGYQVRITKLG